MINKKRKDFILSSLIFLTNINVPLRQEEYRAICYILVDYYYNNSDTVVFVTSSLVMDNDITVEVEIISDNGFITNGIFYIFKNDSKSSENKYTFKSNIVRILNYKNYSGDYKIII